MPTKLTPSFIHRIRQEWTKAFHFRKGNVCVFNPHSSLRNNPPPYVIDPSGYGVEFCKLGNGGSK